MVWIRGPKGSARCLKRLVKCLLALTGSGQVSLVSGHHYPAGDTGGVKAPIGNAFVQPWYSSSSCNKLAWNEPSNRDQGSRGVAVTGARLRGLTGGYVSSNGNMVQGLHNPVSYYRTRRLYYYCSSVRVCTVCCSLLHAHRQ